VSLRNFIKCRDDHTRRSCSVSVAAEPHLLLEVDHVVPVSKGGLSTPEDLQTLCWRCNRTKSNKLATA
jgi:5-methylcytosine-specific restriction endonuclease McrA